MLIARYRSHKEDPAAPQVSVAPARFRFPAVFGDWASTLLRIGIGTLFVWSSVAKLADPKQFTFVIDAFGLLPDALVVPAAVTLSAFELPAGIGLILDAKGAVKAIIGLLLLFMVVLGYGVWMGLDVDCGCFGAGDPEGDAYHGLRPALYRDAVMLAGMGYLLFWRRRRNK